MQNVLKSPFLLFSPFLLLSILIILLFRKGVLIGDEDKYLHFAQNLLHGFYSLPAPNIYIGVGPGYPIVIVPFLLLKLPLISIALVNAIFYYLSIVFLFKALQQIVSMRLSLFASLFLAFYYNSYENFILIAPETITLFLISLLSYLIVLSFDENNKKSKKYIFLAGLILGYIALTKIIFGYVILFMLCGNIVLWLFNRSYDNYRKGIFILLIGFASTIPYLLYTYNLTGKIFYWGTTAGNNMYWMSTPYNEEYGSWSEFLQLKTDTVLRCKSNFEFRQDEHQDIKTGHNTIPGVKDFIISNHRKDYKEFVKYSGVEQDDAFRRKAIENIKSHPIKYAQNLFSNFGRMIFNYPYSYTLQKPKNLLRLPLNGILILFLLISLIPAFINWKRVLFPLRFIIFIFYLYIGGSLTGSAETRMFTVIVPFLLLWISYFIEKTVIIKLRFNEKDTI